MLAGTIDAPNSVETHSQARNQPVAGPVVGASSADASPSTTAGAPVELDGAAVSLTSAASAATETKDRHDDNESPSHARPALDVDTAATNLNLSPEALRLALIPAQTLDPQALQAAQDEIAATKEQLQHIVEVSAAKAEQLGESITPSTAKIKLNIPQREHLPAAPPPSTEASFKPDKSPVQEHDEHVDALPPATQRAIPDRSSEEAYAHGPPSPFDTGAPSATGQSLDIVVGDS